MSVGNDHGETVVVCFVMCLSTNHFFSGGTSAYWVSPESSCLEQDSTHVVLRPMRRDEREKKINGKQLSIPYVGVLFI